MAQIFGFLFGFVVLAIVLVGVFILAGVRLFQGGGDKEQSAREAQLMQELYQGMARMEERVETLETLVLEKDDAPGGEHGRKA